MEKDDSIDNDTNSINYPNMDSDAPDTVPQLTTNTDVEYVTQNKNEQDDTDAKDNDQCKAVDDNNDKVIQANAAKSSISANNVPATSTSGPQIFIVRPLPSRINPNNKIQEDNTKSENYREKEYSNQDSSRLKLRKGLHSLDNAKIPDHYLQCCKDHENIQLELSKENEFLHAALSNAHLQLNEKDVEFQNRVAALNQSYGSSIHEMKMLLSSQRKLGNRWKEEMTTLTQVFETTIKDLSTENKQLRRFAEKLKVDLKEKSMEAKEAKEMNGIYSARITKMERKFKKLRDQDEESYIEMTF